MPNGMLDLQWTELSLQPYNQTPGLERVPLTWFEPDVQMQVKSRLALWAHYCPATVCGYWGPRVDHVVVKYMPCLELTPMGELCAAHNALVPPLVEIKPRLIPRVARPVEPAPPPPPPAPVKPEPEPEPVPVAEPIVAAEPVPVSVPTGLSDWGRSRRRPLTAAEPAIAVTVTVTRRGEWCVGGRVLPHLSPDESRWGGFGFTS